MNAKDVPNIITVKIRLPDVHINVAMVPFLIQDTVPINVASDLLLASRSGGKIQDLARFDGDSIWWPQLRRGGYLLRPEMTVVFPTSVNDCTEGEEVTTGCLSVIEAVTRFCRHITLHIVMTYPPYRLLPKF